MRQDHWFSFKDSCIYAFERTPSHFLDESVSTLFFLHGRFGYTEMWNPLIETLVHQFRCITVDFPGFGRSFSVRESAYSLVEYACLVHELIQKFTLQGERVILVGHDIGGGIAQLCAIRSPEQVASLVLMNSADLTQPLAKVNTRFRGYWVGRKFRKLLKQAKTLHSQVKKDVISQWEGSTSRDALCRALQGLDESWPWHYERQVWKDALRQIVQPVLLLWGKNDVLNPPDVAIDLVQRLPESYYYLHEEAGHWPYFEQPQWVLEKMRKFIFDTKKEAVKSKFSA